MLLYEQLKNSASDPFQKNNELNYIDCNDSVKQLVLNEDEMKNINLACETHVVSLF